MYFVAMTLFPVVAFETFAPCVLANEEEQNLQRNGNIVLEALSWLGSNSVDNNNNNFSPSLFQEKWNILQQQQQQQQHDQQQHGPAPQAPMAWLRGFENLPSFKTSTSSTSQLPTHQQQGRQRSHHHDHQQQQPQQERKLVSKCGDILATYNVTELQDYMQAVANQLFQGSELLLFSFAVIPRIKYGLSVRKICATCVEFPGLCRHNDNMMSDKDDDDYAANVTHSGLVLFPLTRDGVHHQPGTHVGSIVCHGTQGSSFDVPSSQWIADLTTNSNDHRFAADDIIVLAGALFAGLAGSATIFPDYIGYGESANRNNPPIYRPYLIKRAYRTATLPLWYKAQNIVQIESNCQAAIANAVVITGYSEGGYAAVAVAEAFSKRNETKYSKYVSDYPNTTIVQVFAGGAPFRLSSVQIGFSLQRIQAGTFDRRSRYYLALLGSSFSSTYPLVANYQRGQDWLSHEIQENTGNSDGISTTNRTIRQTLIDVVHSGADREGINAVIPLDDLLSTVSPVLIQIFLQALEEGQMNPCDSSIIVVGESELICQALKEQDLAHSLENVVDYPVSICHSLGDKLVSPDNRPDFSKNPQYLSSYEITGNVGHSSAGPFCFFKALDWYLQDDNYIEQFSAKGSGHEGMLHSPTGCNGEGEFTASSFSASPTLSPTQKSAAESLNAVPVATVVMKIYYYLLFCVCGSLIWMHY